MRSAGFGLLLAVWAGWPGTLPAQPLPVHVLVFDADPFRAASARVVGAFPAADWTSAPAGLPAALVVRTERFDAGRGLVDSGSLAIAPLPNDAVFALPNQVESDLSVYSARNLAAVARDLDGNGLDDAWEIRFFGRAGVDPGADADGDGFGNRAEFLAGTDPTDAASRPALEGLLGRWAGDGNLRDGVGGHDGVAAGEIGYGEGRTGSAVWLAGRGHVRIPDAADLRSITALTLAAWVRFEQLTPNGLPVIIRPSSVAGIPAYGLEIGSQGPRLRLASLAGSRSDGPVTNLTAGAWHHLAATWDGSVVRFYLGGEPMWADRVNAAFGALDLPPGPDLLLGHDGRTGFFEGALDDVLLAGRALSEAEIRELANPPAAEPWAVNVELVPAGAAGAGTRLRFGWPLAGAGEVVLEASEGLGEGWAPASAEVRELGGRRFLEVPVEAGVRARFFRLRR